MMPLRRKLEGITDFANIKESDDDIEAPVSMEDFLLALNSIQKSVA